jgi:hypothetical protein
MAENKGIRKTIYFSENDEYLLNHALKQSNNFAAYVKELIKKDMEKESFESKVTRIVEKYLKDKEISITESKSKETKFNEEDINALNILMKRD